MAAQPAEGISFVVLADETAYVNDPEPVTVDYALSAPGRLDAALYSEFDAVNPLRTWAISRDDVRPRMFKWDKKVDGKPAAPGEYVLTLRTRDTQAQAVALTVTLLEGTPETMPVSVTGIGDFLPFDKSPEALSKALAAPVTVVNIGALEHQRIYAAPDTRSAVVGVVHGQTAGAEVLEADIHGFARVRVARHGDGAWVTGYIPLSKLKVVAPDGRYGIVVDKGAQTLSVYKGGELLGSMAVSSGICVPPGDDSMDTLSGAFLTLDRVAEFTDEGFRYAYGIRIDGGNLIHQIGYRLVEGVADFSAQRAQLGAPASHGCVRVDDRAVEGGLNAWWLYANIPRGTKVLVLPGNTGEDTAGDAAGSLPDSITPFAFQVVGETEPAGAAEAVSVPVRAFDSEIVLTFGGDCVLGSEEHTRKDPASFDSAVAKNGMAWPFSGVSEIFLNDDLTQVNLEVVLKDDAKGKEISIHNFRGPAAFAGILTEGNVELVNVANNHFPDYGQAGKDATRAALDAAGIAHSGYGTLYTRDFDGFKVGFGGIRETIFKQDEGRVASEIAELQAQGCGFIVYTMHFGPEYASASTDLQRRMARLAVDAGADLVIGHHPHVVQGVEEYGGGLILYSLGNLVFGGNLELTTFWGLLAQVRLGLADGQLAGWEMRLIPVLTSGAAPDNDFRPVPAQGEDKERILYIVNASGGTDYPETLTIPVR